MNFNNKFPKQEITIVTQTVKGSLLHNNYCEVHYRDYKGYLDTVVYYVIKGDKNAWFDIKSSFKYDEMMGIIKSTYNDSFKRKMTVIKIN